MVSGRSSVSFHIPAEGKVNQRLREWVASFDGQSRRQRSAAIREAIYQHHIANGASSAGELYRMVSQQAELLRQLAEQLTLIQTELQQLRRQGLIIPDEAAPPIQAENEQKLKQLTRKFF